MVRSSSLRLAALLLVAPVIALPAATAAQQGASGEWRVYGGDPGHTFYSSLDQINAQNAQTLEVAWRWSARNFGTNPLASALAIQFLGCRSVLGSVSVMNSIVTR